MINNAIYFIFQFISFVNALYLLVNITHIIQQICQINIQLITTYQATNLLIHLCIRISVIDEEIIQINVVTLYFQKITEQFHTWQNS